MKSTTKGAALDRMPLPRRSRINRGQTATEFALILPLAFIALLVGVQYALLGQSALALSQGSSALARYEAVHPGTIGSGKASSLPNAAQQMLSPTILSSGGGDLTVAVTAPSGTGFGGSCAINLSYSTTSKMVLPNQFFGIPLFPTTLSASSAQTYE